MNTPPPVSIGMPVHNGAAFIEDALNSLLSQSFGEFELIVSDNASTDQTVDIVTDLAARDDRIRVLRQPENVGAAGNYNIVFHQSRAALFKWAAHDDVCGPTFLSSTLSALECEPSAVLAYPRTQFIDQAGLATGSLDEPTLVNGATASARLRSLLDDPAHSPLQRCHPVLGLIRRATLERTRLISTRQSADKVLLVELALLGRFARIEEELFRRRIHDDNHRAARATPEEVARWYDPAAGDRFPMPLATELRGYTSAVLLHAPSIREKVACGAVIADWLRRDRRPRVLAGELRRTFASSDRRASQRSQKRSSPVMP